MGTIDFLHKNAIVKFRGDVFVVTNYQHVKPGKGGAFVKTKLKNIRTGASMDQTFHDANAIESAQVDRRNLNFLYSDENFVNFMDGETYEQIELNKEMIGDALKFLKEGQKVIGVFHEEKAITIELPNKVKLKVTTSPPGAKGDTASGTAMKEIELETGAKIMAPVFIKEGEVVAVKTEDGSYAERVN